MYGSDLAQHSTFWPAYVLLRPAGKTERLCGRHFRGFWPPYRQCHHDGVCATGVPTALQTTKSLFEQGESCPIESYSTFSATCSWRAWLDGRPHAKTWVSRFATWAA